MSEADARADIVRRASPDRYFASLYAPAEARFDLHALYAFEAEIAQVRAKVSTPMLGEIRLQWWRDALEAGDGQGNPLAEDLIALTTRHDLPMQALVDLISARIFDLYDDPFPTQDDLEGYAAETLGRPAMLAARILAPDMPTTGTIADVAGHGAVMTHLRDAAFGLLENAQTGQTFAPADMITAKGATLERLRGDEAARAELRDALLTSARAHGAAFAAASDVVPPAARPAFMPQALALRDVARGPDDGPLPRWRRLWALRGIARKGLA